MSNNEEILAVFREFLDCILVRRDLRGLLNLLSPEIAGFGTADHELLNDFPEVKAQYERQFAQVDQPIYYKMYYEKVLHPTPDVAVVMAKINMYAELPEGPLRLNGFRRTVVFRREKGGWKVCHFHASLPEADVKPGEAYPLQAIAERNRELERLVLERTRELERQAQELKQAQSDAEAKTRLVERQNKLLLLEIKERRLVEEKLRASEEQLRYLAQTDPLTGGHNRRSFIAYAEAVFPEQQPLALLILDLDHFKDVNDTFGHQVGDQVLHCFAERVMKVLREGEVFGRLGGEEFGVFIPGQGLEYALELAETIRTTAQETICTTNKGQVRVTVSIGAAEKEAGDFFDDLYLRADTALYRAKGQGRNTVKCDRLA